MKILCLGSLNHDYVYAVPHAVRPGETLSATAMTAFCGGKGLNQAVALARAGAQPRMAGQVGRDGTDLLSFLEAQGVDTHLIGICPDASGHTIIQVEPTGQNCILVYGGANRSLTREQVDAALSEMETGDALLLQNEINGLAYILQQAQKRGLFIALNPSPIDEGLRQCPLDAVSLFFINEIEGHELTGRTQPHEILDEMHVRYPLSDIVLTLGRDGVTGRLNGHIHSHGIYSVPVADTTAAGDTFTGFFLAALAQKHPAEECLRRASVAAAIAVSRPGAAPSIPTLDEVLSAQLTLA